MIEFTDQQKENWKKYEKVRAGGKWNMFDSRARRATGLTKEDYFFCINNYEELNNSINLLKQ
jgi:hypothetical protein